MHLAKAFVNLMQLTEMKRKAQISQQGDTNMISEHNVFGNRHSRDVDNSLVSHESIYRKMLKLKSIIDVLAEQINQKFPQVSQGQTDYEQA